MVSGTQIGRVRAWSGIVALAAVAQIALGGGTVAPLIVNDKDATLKASWVVPLDASGRGRIAFVEASNTAAYASLIGGQSIGGSTEVDCGARVFQLDDLAIYPQKNLAGQPVYQVGRLTDWRAAEAGTTLGRVVVAACNGFKPPRHGVTARPAHLVQAVDRPVATPRPAPPVLDAQPAPQPVLQPISVAEDENLVLRPSEQLPRSSEVMGELVATWPTSHPVDRAIVQVQPIVAVRPVQLTSPVIAATVVAMKSAPRYYVQVGAPRSVALADSTWRRIKGSSPALLASLPRRFEPSVVRGVRYYRILVGGFARQADAAGLCGRLAQANLACIIRARRDG